jgi:hypothetical protein
MKLFPANINLFHTIFSNCSVETNLKIIFVVDESMMMARKRNRTGET